jgi:hypothetical protein
VGVGRCGPDGAEFGEEGEEVFGGAVVWESLWSCQYGLMYGYEFVMGEYLDVKATVRLSIGSIISLVHLQDFQGGCGVVRSLGRTNVLSLTWWRWDSGCARALERPEFR